jgi:hypothetical protein
MLSLNIGNIFQSKQTITVGDVNHRRIDARCEFGEEGPGRFCCSWVGAAFKEESLNTGEMRPMNLIENLIKLLPAFWALGLQMLQDLKYGHFRVQV